MQFRKLLSEDDAVSPVIGVILMVAITVILAAVIASFVLGLGGDSDVQPNTALNFDYSPVDENLTVTVSSGDSLDPNEVYLRGEFAGEGTTGIDQPVNAALADIEDPDVDDNLEGVGEVDISGVGGLGYEPTEGGVTEEISSGQGIEFSADPSEESLSETSFDVVWDTGDDSATLDGFDGPDA